jgi:hypothetical protein
MVHILPNVKDIRSTDVLLITFPNGEKYQMKYSDFYKQIEKEILKKIPKEQEFIVTIEDVLKALNTQGTVNFIKPINILNNKKTEKDIKVPGALYTDGERVRIRLKNGWKTIQLKDE